MKKPLSKEKLLPLIFAILCGIIMIISGVKIVLWKIDSANTNAEITELQEKTEVKEIEDDDSAEVISEESGIDPNDPYWKYLETPLLSVNLANLKAENPDTVGWLRLEGTNVNYPFVKSSDNDFYLYHSFSKNYNSAGWVFLDYRNSPALSDKISIIYAHGRTDNTMFGSLRNLLSNVWRSNPDNFLIRTVTSSSSNIYQIFSVYLIPVTSDYLRISFGSNSSFKEFADMISSRSNFDFRSSVSETDKILTLSTCYDNSRRLVVHGKLIKTLQN